jgi:hypothetical protein
LAIRDCPGFIERSIEPVVIKRVHPDCEKCKYKLLFDTIKAWYDKTEL